MQVIWTLHHYRLPLGIDPFDFDFATRFAGYCEQVARCLKPFTDSPPVFQPINEISFFSWAVAQTHLMHPHTSDSGASRFDLKCNLVRAALQELRCAVVDSSDNAHGSHRPPDPHRRGRGRVGGLP